MTLPRALKWIAGLLLAPVVLAVLFIAIFGWGWPEDSIERTVSERTGRALRINGELSVSLAWPLLHVHADKLTFANPEWATEKQMIAADAADVSIHLPQLLMRKIIFPEVRLVRPVIFLEQGTKGRKNWLLDIEQRNEAAHIRIGRLMLDHGVVGYDDAAQKTHLRAELSTLEDAPSHLELAFSGQGQYKGLPVKVRGNSGPVLGLRDESAPYRLQFELNVGSTGITADGAITSLLQLSAFDMQLALRGDSLAQLYPLLGLAFPQTRAYAMAGRAMHDGKTWTYEQFAGRVGESDIAGTMQIDTGGRRPALKADLVSRVLDFADLGPLIGARSGAVDAARRAAPVAGEAAAPPPEARVLPEMPFRTERWRSVDAEVSLKAGALRRAEALPLDSLVTHLSLRDAVLTLDPLDFGIADGHLKAVVSLDGRADPIRAQARVRASKIRLARLIPGFEQQQTGIGQVYGEFDLAGQGNSVRDMLARSEGQVKLVTAGGRISRLMMEKAGLHLFEILQLNLTGDNLVELRCGIADFKVKDGNMRAEVLLFDTQVTTLIGTGNIDLTREKLDLTFNQKTKRTSPFALRSPIHVQGTLARPVVSVAKEQVAARAFGALALGIVNPLLALLPLIDAGPGSDSDCGQLAQEAKAYPRQAAANK